MKKLLSMLFVLPLIALMVSCDDDDKNIPDVSLSIDYSGATLNDGVLYVVQGDTLSIDSLIITPAPGTGKAIFGNVTYSVDGIPFYRVGISPWDVSIITDNMSLGTHTLGVSAQIFQVDKSVGFGIFTYKFEVVASPDDQPDDTGSGSDTPQAMISETSAE